MNKVTIAGLSSKPQFPSTASVAGSVVEAMRSRGAIRESGFYLFPGFAAEWTLGRPEMTSSYAARKLATKNGTNPAKDSFRVPVRIGFRTILVPGFFLANAIVVKERPEVKDLEDSEGTVYQGVWLSTQVDIYGATRLHSIATVEEGLSLPDTLRVHGAVIDGEVVDGVEVPYLPTRSWNGYSQLLRAWISDPINADAVKKGLTPNRTQLKDYLTKLSKGKSKAAGYWKSFTFEPTMKSRYNRGNWFPTLIVSVG